MKLLVVIPARGGSKGIPLKNIYPLNGKPLIEYAIESIIKSNIDCDMVVSTDSEKISKVANKYQEVLVIKRPKNISGDTATTESAIMHALEYMEKTQKKIFDYVITRQATSPLLKSQTIKSFVEEFLTIKNKYDAQLTLTKKYSDYWIKNNGKYSRLFPDAPRRRQDRSPIYIENSAMYITSVQTIRETKSILGNNTNGFVIDEIEGLDINNYKDLDLAEFYLQNGNNH